MKQIIGVRFKQVGKVYYFNPNGLNIKKGDFVIVETSKGVEFGECMVPNSEVSEDRIVQPLKDVIRAATEEDERIVAQNREKEKYAMEICNKKLSEHKLEMKIVDVEYTFDASKIIFYFTAEGRIDFRDLVKDLAAVFRTRIELRQIGVRDEAKMLGGLGICGKPFCCSTFLDEFLPVSIKMAKEQNLSLNPAKISGSCGRLMCCLKYEQEAYEHLLKNTPRVDSLVDTPDGRGAVTDVSLLRELVTVRLDGDDGVIKCYKNCDVSRIKNNMKTDTNAKACDMASDEGEATENGLKQLED